MRDEEGGGWYAEGGNVEADRRRGRETAGGKEVIEGGEVYRGRDYQRKKRALDGKREE